ncbi:uncharacterized protein PRCAT00005432001 [Priceomyces carsonii]|uniref:uncharacterized protein n=1 Tax=Priceomyces carsonii TaxID=28549 RepID=UPI002EDA18C0|nr:unnamed protein product [Priceomyces carsonii]
MSRDFSKSEELDGVRFNWNLLPSTRLEASQLSTPIGCLYTPLHQRSNQNLQIEETSKPALVCATCGCHINPHIKLDRANMMWWCPFCNKRTFLPKDYEVPQPKASADEWPMELRQNSSTIEYNLPESISDKLEEDFPYVFMFVIDLYEHIEDTQDSFASLIKHLVESIDNIPSGSLVGIMSFDEHVSVHRIYAGPPVTFSKNEIIDQDLEEDLTNSEKFDYKTIFSELALTKISNKLGLDVKISGLWKESLVVKMNYFVQLTDLSKRDIINYLQSLRSKPTNSYKPLRSTGLSQYVASVLLSRSSYRYLMGKVLLFSSGPCTTHPGLVLDNKSTMRSHNDIADLSAKNFAMALKFYETLSHIANGQSFDTAVAISSSTSKKASNFPVNEGSPKWSIDLFAGSLDQVGVYEMKALPQNTMGTISLFDSFSSLQFQPSLLDSLTLGGVGAKLKILTSNSAKFSKFISGGYPLPPSYSSAEAFQEKISDNLTKFDSALSKRYFTNQWQFNSIKSQDTISLFFEIDTERSSSDLTSSGPLEIYFQFILKYWDYTKKVWKLRVTTISRSTTLAVLVANTVKMSDGSSRLINSKSTVVKEQELLASFDQNAWTVILAKILINRIDTSLGFENFDGLVKTTDQTLLKLLYYFGGLSVTSDAEKSSNPYLNQRNIYELNGYCKLLPGLVYNLRKNPHLVRIFNSSPDETAYNHLRYSRLKCDYAIKVIKPDLFKLSKGKAEAISLDSKCLDLPSKTFLVMDCFFHIVIHYISDEQNKLPLHNSNNEELIKNHDECIKEPLDFIFDVLLQLKRPYPKIILSQTNHSQSRYLLARLSPADKTTLPDFKTLSLEEEKRGIWKFFRKLKSSEEKTYDFLTDDISVKQYYDSLVELLKGYKVEDEYD